MVTKRTAYYDFMGAIDTDTVSRIMGALDQAVKDGYEQIYLCLTSTGGGLIEGFHLYNFLKSLPIPIVIHNVSYAASIAAAILLAGNTRYCSPHAVFMIHTTSWTLNGPANAVTLQNVLANVTLNDQRLEALLRRGTSIPERLFIEYKQQEVTFGAQQAKEFGIVDSIEDFSLPQGSQLVRI